MMCETRLLHKFLIKIFHINFKVRYTVGVGSVITNIFNYLKPHYNDFHYLRVDE